MIRKYKNKIISKESEIYKNQKILLTFDDGLTDHFAVAKNYLKNDEIFLFLICHTKIKNFKCACLV